MNGYQPERRMAQRRSSTDRRSGERGTVIPPRRNNADRRKIQFSYDML